MPSSETFPPVAFYLGNEMEKFCLVIPIYRHLEQFKAFVTKLPAMPIFLINDGNSPSDREQLSKIAARHHLILISLPHNQGKNAALLAGMKAAYSQGFDYAVQIDADGQHQVEDIAKFINLSKQNPQAIINACPIYDHTVPKSRLYGRKITNFWVVIETGGCYIKDAMCGFRVYPLKPLTPLLNRGLVFNRMGGDIEIIVKAHWMGLKIINVPTKVVYPKDGFSNFRTFTDNLKISLLHSLLVTLRLKNLFLRLIKWKN